MQGVITAPKKIITGAFTILFTFIREIELTADAIHVETLEGDALGHTKDNFAGSGQDYHILCYLPDGRKGKSRISVVKDGFDVPPVVVAYDTVRTVHATYGTPIKRNRKIEIPLSFDVPIEQLKKRNFNCDRHCAFQIYGSGNAYSLVMPDSGVARTVTVSGSVRKLNGVRAEIQETTLEV